jgi:hypothetical protein
MLTELELESKYCSGSVVWKARTACSAAKYCIKTHNLTLLMEIDENYSNTVAQTTPRPFRFHQT